MKPEEVFRRYDIRGKHPEEIDEEFAELIGKATGTFAKRHSTGKVNVCKDTKETSIELKEAVVRGLKTTGVEIFDSGTGPTDYAAFSGSCHDAVTLQVTSSHLPLETNGFKMIYPEGNGFNNDDLGRLKQIFRDRDFETGESEVEEIDSEAREKYIEAAKKFFGQYFNEIDRKIVVETMGGAATAFLPQLLEELGAEVIDLDEEKDGPYIDPPDPKPDNLEHVEQRVEEEQADLGIATDMDADRVAVYNGEWLDGNDIFSILVAIIEPEKTVASVDTSQKVEQVAEKFGEIFHTRVGDPFVSGKMLEIDADFSGEPNGHYCFPEFSAYNSGTVSALLLAAADLEELKGDIPEFHNRRTSVEVEDKEEAMQKFSDRVTGLFNIVSKVDGFKFRTGDASVLVRTSGSSEKLRIVADAPTQIQAFVGMRKAEMLID